MSTGAVAKTQLYIADPGVIVASPDPYTEITDINNIGELGIQFQAIAMETIGDGYTRQLKGTQSSPSLPLVLNRDNSDAGQQALKAAAEDATQALYNFKIVLNDTGNSSPTNFVFKGKVMSFISVFGGVNDPRRANAAIEVEPDTITETVAV